MTSASVNGGSYKPHHVIVQFVNRLYNPWRIGKNDLKIFTVHNAKYPDAALSGFGCDNGQAFPDQFIHECGFSHIGISDNIYKT